MTLGVAVLPLPTPDGPGGPGPDRVGAVLETVVRSLGVPAIDSLVTVHERWSDLVGPEVAAVSRPVSIREGVLVVNVDGSAWADHLRWSADDVLARSVSLVGPDVIRSLDVRTTRRGRA